MRSGVQSPGPHTKSGSNPSVRGGDKEYPSKLLARHAERQVPDSVRNSVSTYKVQNNWRDTDVSSSFHMNMHTTHRDENTKKKRKSVILGPVMKLSSVELAYCASVFNPKTTCSISKIISYKTFPIRKQLEGWKSGVTYLYSWHAGSRSRRIKCWGQAGYIIPHFKWTNAYEWMDR